MKESETLLLNLSNHPFDKWLPKQKEMAMKRWGRVEDIAFPHIPPAASEEELDELVEVYTQKILNLKPTAAHVMGEMTFVYRMVNRLQKLGISCVASTTNRKVEFLPDGTKKSIFEFVNFRKY